MTIAKCKICDCILTWSQQKRILRKMIKKNIPYHQAKKAMPLCSQHLIYADIQNRQKDKY